MSIVQELNEYLDPYRYRLGTRLIEVELLRRIIRHVEKQELIICEMREAIELAMSKSCGHCAGEMSIARKLWEQMEVEYAKSNPDGDS